jgi:hypothetical protein
MKVLENGYRYLLESAEGTNDQQLQFIERVKWEQVPHTADEVPVDGYITKTDGVYNEELIKVLIHRMNVQNSKEFSPETKQAIEYLEQAYQVLKVRELRKQTDFKPKPATVNYRDTIQFVNNYWRVNQEVGYPVAPYGTLQTVGAADEVDRGQI